MSCAPATAGIIDKRAILAGKQAAGPLQLELGCGSRKRYPNTIGVDLLDYECVDIVGDAHAVLARLPDASVESITSSHFLEHVSDVCALLDEMGRVLTVGGRLEIVVPHFSNPYFYSDLTHRHPFGLYTLSYFVEDNVLSRKVPRYGVIPRLGLVEVELRFKAERPFYGRYLVKRLFGFLVNSSYYTKEFYEENLTALFPCYELRYVAQKLPERAR